MSRTVGILGGSFDPVHDAHLELARRVLEQTECDEVWFLPAAVAIHKLEGASVSAEHRRAMLELAITGQERMRVCDHELQMGTPQRSVHSLEALARMHPDISWRFIMGGDSWAELDSWYQPERLLQLAAPIVLGRVGVNDERDSERFGVRVAWLRGEELDCSSTAIRRALARGEVAGQLPAGVAAYIARHELYKGEPTA